MNTDLSDWSRRAALAVWQTGGLLLAALCLATVVQMLMIQYLHYVYWVVDEPSLISNLEWMPLGSEPRVNDPFGFNIVGALSYLFWGSVWTFIPALVLLAPLYYGLRWMTRRRRAARQAVSARAIAADAADHRRRTVLSWVWRWRGLMALALLAAMGLNAAKIVYLHHWDYAEGGASHYANRYWASPDSEAHRDRPRELHAAATFRLFALGTALTFLPALGVVGPFHALFRRPDASPPPPGHASPAQRMSDLP